jgi:hypothetical protein
MKLFGLCAMVCTPQDINELLKATLITISIDQERLTDHGVKKYIQISMTEVYGFVGSNAVWLRDSKQFTAYFCWLLGLLTICYSETMDDLQTTWSSNAETVLFTVAAAITSNL